jgi:hypothetical protein
MTANISPNGLFVYAYLHLLLSFYSTMAICLLSCTEIFVDQSRCRLSITLQRALLRGLLRQSEPVIIINV